VIGLIFPVFFAGIVSFLSPCTLPLLPGFLGLVSGASLLELKQEEGAEKLRSKALAGAFAFCVGFGAAYTVLGIFSRA
jgi:cytochrome c-type biogenesis protein